MSAEFKRCPNGHYYQGDSCPYCKSSSSTTGTMTGSMGEGMTQKTEVFNNGFGGGMDPNATMPAGGMGGGKTQVVGQGGGGFSSNKTTVVDNGTGNNSGSAPMSNRTVFGDDFGGTMSNDGQPSKPSYRQTRKLVGWLVSYTLEAMGVDFKLYEGRNIIGRDMECNITVNDKMVSSKHAVILYRAGKYSITDQQSSHGTFVNGEDTELDPYYLKDGDEIRMGETIFKFRTSF